MCDNARDLEMIPSNLSDFSIYGGLYRYVNLVYVPAISLERVHVDSELLEGDLANMIVRGRLYNPLQLKDELELTITGTDPEGHVIYNNTRRVKPWLEKQDIT